MPHLPFEVLVRNGMVWVTTHKVKELKTGDQLLAMNNVAVSAIKDPAPGHGLAPAYVVEYTAQDVVMKKDVDMEKV